MIAVGVVLGLVPCANLGLLGGLLAGVVWVVLEDTPKERALRTGAFAGFLLGVGSLVPILMSGQKMEIMLKGLLANAGLIMLPSIVVGALLAHVVGRALNPDRPGDSK